MEDYIRQAGVKKVNRLELTEKHMQRCVRKVYKECKVVEGCIRTERQVVA